MAFSDVSLPKLPGMTYDYPQMNARNRPQTLIYKNGFAFPREDVNVMMGNATLADLGAGMSTFGTKTNGPGLATGGAGGAGSSQAWAEAQAGTGAGGGPAGTLNMSTAPDWVAFDRQVLRFYAFFKEAVTDSAVENQRVRKCVIFYYLDDGSLYIAEPKTVNSGMPQGVLLKKHKVPKADGTFVSWHDVAVGEILTLYSRSYYVTGADPFTRTFYSERGVELAPDERNPDGPYETLLNSTKGFKKSLGPPKARTDDFTRFTEAKLGKASNALTERETLGQFLANDGKVLRFFCLWDTRGQLENGERRLYTLNYYLADDTVEVLETKDPAGGRDPWARMLRRSKLPSVKIAVDAGGPTKSFPSYDFTALRVGKYLSVFGREFLLYDADRFTKEWYAKKGIDQSGSLDVSEAAPPRPKPALPPYNGYGLLADSAQNCVSLLPKPPKADFVKLTQNDRKVLRFRAVLVDAPGVPSVTQADVERSFVISFFLTDDTLSVYEPSIRNTGFPGGKFLERGIVTKDGSATGARFQGPDFFVGARIRVYNRIFELVEADGFTLNHMEQSPGVWQASDLDLVLAMVRMQADGEALRALFDAAGPAVKMADLAAMLRAAGAPLTQAQLVTIGRQWSADGNAPVPSAQLLSLVYPE